MEGDDDDIQIALFQAFVEAGCEVFLDMQRHVWCKPMQCRDEMRQQVGGDGIDGAEAQGADQLVLSLPGNGLDGAGFFQHPLCLRNHLFANGGQGDFAGATLEQRNAEFFFQFANGHAQRRLADKAGFRRAAEMVGAGKSDDVAQFSQCHGEILTQSGVGVCIAAKRGRILEADL